MKPRGVFGLLGVVLLVLAVSLLCAAEEGEYGGVIQAALGVSPPYLDWQQTTAGACEAIACHIFETLTTFSREFEDIPQLAKSWELSEDRLTWTFHLRQGVKFQKGYGELTAEDVKASIERFIRVAERGSDFGNVTDIVVVDPYTIKFVLSSPTRLLTALSTTVNGAGIYPKAVIDQYGDVPIPAEGIVGTGPYELESWTEERVVIRRFADYTPMTDFAATGYGGHRIAYLDKVVFNYVPEAGARIAGLETGQYDLITEVPLSEAARLEQIPGLELRALSPYYKPLYFVNCTKWPTSDPRIRLALRLAADMERVLNFTAYGQEDFYDANNSVFFIDQPKWWWDACLDQYSPDDDAAAKRLMEEAG
ncbi:MAG: ABC transporter substrate-binding protein [Candidatus Bipolaricaulaceae bacterium]